MFNTYLLTRLAIESRTVIKQAYKNQIRQAGTFAMVAIMNNLVYLRALLSLCSLPQHVSVNTEATRSSPLYSYEFNSN